MGQNEGGWLRTFLDLPGGIPSHDTLARVFRHLDPKELHVCFLRWRESLVCRGNPQVAVDGKTLRRRRAGWDDAYLFRLLSIWMRSP